MSWQELPLDIKLKAKEVILSKLTSKDKRFLKSAIKSNPEDWWSAIHFNWGMYIRNQLRVFVCLDNQLPTENWDDYYAECIEFALDFRKE
jgi:hypothetical protein